MTLVSLLFVACHNDHEHHNHGKEMEEYHHHDHNSHGDHHNHTHKAYHDGVLNIIESCEVGHAEVKVNNGQLDLWFVGGSDHTDRSVRVKETEINLKITTEDSKIEKLLLEAAPLELAEESIGDCSHFVGKADWLKDIKNFRGESEIIFKGKKMKLIIDYPHGFDDEVVHIN